MFRNLDSDIYCLIKKEKEDVIVGFLNGRDVFAVLPTGFGYACLPLVFDGIGPLHDGLSSIVWQDLGTK